ncbi:hypothetical protein [uncultured Dokdonia sp.]|uniref:hypothetical protein n=1 Tax=uncultured Dokdonia sp. TaxID=575653 RepID=UPI002626A095|nr:hypothetical protein [uncultured Dokdonia sp.]
MEERIDHSNENDYKIILGLVKGFLQTKKFIFASILTFVLIGIVVVIFTPKTYSSRVLFITQDSSSAQSSGLGGIASLISGGGIKASGTTDIPTFLYPQIIDSWEFRKQLFDIPLKLKNEDSLITFKEYALEKEGLSFSQTISKYTIGLPSLIFSRNNDESKSALLPRKVIDSLEYISSSDRKVLQSLREKISFSISKEDGTLEIKTILKEEPVAAAQLAQQVQLLLQKEVIRYRIAKAQEKYEFIENQYQETKQEYKDAQIRLASYTDRNRFNTTESSLIRKRQLENEANLLYALYSDLEQKRISQSLKIKEDTPNFTVINPALISSIPENSSSFLTLVIFALIGFLVAFFRYVATTAVTYVKRLWNGV